MKLLVLSITLSVVSAMQGGQEDLKTVTCADLIGKFVDPLGKLIYNCVTRQDPKTKQESERILGQGSFGKVFMVQTVDGGQPYAMKVQQVVKKGKLDSDAKDEADSEYQIALQKWLGKSPSPNLMQAFGRKLAGSFTLMIIEFFDQGTLWDYLDPKTPGNYGIQNIDKWLPGFLGVAEGVKALHDHEFIHRDLKPENIGIQKGTWKIFDYGLACKAGEKGQGIAGTPEYIDPEYASEKAPLPVKAIDMYSLGIIFYELVTGHHPYPQGKKHVEFYEYRAALKNDLVKIPKGTPKVFVEAIKNLLVGDHNARWTIDQLIAALKTYSSVKPDVIPAELNIRVYSPAIVPGGKENLGKLRRALLGSEIQTASSKTML